MTYEVRVTSLTVLPAGEPTYSERATEVEIQDEVGCDYLLPCQACGGI